MNEEQEWLEELVERWAQTYKKSASTLLLLQIVRDLGPVTTPEIAEELEQRSGWTLSERGLYRTLQRLATSDLLTAATSPVPRSGLQRNQFTLTEFGRKYLTRIESLHRRTQIQ